LKRIVLKACAYERADRYRDADEMLRDLEALEVNKSDDSRETGAGVVPKKPAGLRAAMMAAAACVVIAIGIWAFIPKEVTDIDVGDLEDGAEIYIGDSLALKCAVKPDRFKDEQVAFSSGDEKVFTVSEDGVIQAGSPGQASLTMNAKNYSEEHIINVMPKVTSIGGIDETISLTTGDTLTLEPVLSPEKFANEPVTFASGDENIVTVSGEGLLTAVSAGDTKVTVESDGCTFTASVDVSDPIIYYYPSTTSNKSSSGTASAGSSKKSGSNSGNSKKGYFDSSDDEHF